MGGWGKGNFGKVAICFLKGQGFKKVGRIVSKGGFIWTFPLKPRVKLFMLGKGCTRKSARKDEGKKFREPTFLQFLLGLDL